MCGPGGHVGLVENRMTDVVEVPEIEPLAGGIDRQLLEFRVGENPHGGVEREVHVMGEIKHPAIGRAGVELAVMMRVREEGIPRPAGTGIGGGTQPLVHIQHIVHRGVEGRTARIEELGHGDDAGVIILILAIFR